MLSTTMNQTLRFLRVFALGAWLGAMIYFAAVVTQGAFEVLPSLDLAGRLVGFTLSGLHLMGLIAAIVFILASIGMRRSLRAFIEPAVIGVILMAILTIASQDYVIPRMNVLREKMGSVQATPANDTRRAAFDKLHSASVDLEGGVLLLGLISLFLTTRKSGVRRRDAEDAEKSSR
jgi:amino acid transporter